jgi:hypothetical protein
MFHALTWRMICAIVLTKLFIDRGLEEPSSSSHPPVGSLNLKLCDLGKVIPWVWVLQAEIQGSHRNVPSWVVGGD